VGDSPHHGEQEMTIGGTAGEIDQPGDAAHVGDSKANAIRCR
jgi:hypothetical protein